MKSSKGSISSLLFISISFLLAAFLLSCSGGGGLQGWFKFRDTGAGEDSLTKSEAKRFVSGIRSAPTNADAYYQLGLYYQERSRHREAIDEFTKAVTADPSAVKAYNARGVSYDKLGEYSAAVGSYETALAVNPDLDYVKNNLGYSYILQGNPDRAIPVLREALTMNRESKAIHNNLGKAYAMKSRFNEAFAEFKAAGGEGYAYSMIADYQYKTGNFDGAKGNYERAVKADNFQIEVRNRLKAAGALARISQPVDVKRQVAESDPGHILVVKETSPEKAAADAAGEAVRSAFSEAKVELSNGNGVNAMAKRLSVSLKGKGIRVARLTNAGNFNYQSTRIYYRNGYEDAARELSKQLPVGPEAKETDRLDRKDIKIKVLMGRDLVQYNSRFK